MSFQVQNSEKKVRIRKEIKMKFQNYFPLIAQVQWLFKKSFWLFLTKSALQKKKKKKKLHKSQFYDRVLVHMDEKNIFTLKENNIPFGDIAEILHFSDSHYGHISYTTPKWSHHQIF